MVDSSMTMRPVGWSSPRPSVLAPDLSFVEKSADDIASEKIVLDPNTLEPKGQTTVDWFVPSPDGSQQWNVYHAIERLDCKPNAYACRDLRMQPMHFDADGAPVLGQPVDAGVALPAPSGDRPAPH